MRQRGGGVGPAAGGYLLPSPAPGSDAAVAAQLSRARLTQRRGGGGGGTTATAATTSSGPTSASGAAGGPASSASSGASSSWEISSPGAADRQTTAAVGGGSSYHDDTGTTSRRGMLTNRQRQRLFDRTRLEDYHTVFRNPHHVPDGQYKDFISGRRGLGLSRQQRGGGVNGRKRPRSSAAAVVPVEITADCCASGCSMFSLAAAAFLVWVGIMVDRQPLYIKGTLPAQLVQSQTQNGKFVVQYLLPSGSNGYGGNNHHSQGDGGRLPMASSAYRAAFAYLLVAAGCYYVLNRDWFCAQWRRVRQGYERIPDHHFQHHALPTTHHRGRSNDDGDDDGEDGHRDDFSIHTSPFRKRLYDEDVDDLYSSSAQHTQAYQQGVWNQTVANVRQWLAVRGWYVGPVHRTFGGGRRKRDPKMV